MIRSIVFTFAVGLVAGACAADSSSRLGDQDVVDTTLGDSAGRDGAGRPDADPGDATATDTDTAESDAADTPAGGGTFLDPCGEDSECLSGYCVLFDGARVCTEFCFDEGCEEGWECRFVSGVGSDTVRICVPDRETLCSPCETDLDCGGFGDLCVRVGDGGFCARDCQATQECPEGYLCDPSTSVEGLAGEQCLPIGGRCSCPPDQYGESRPCVRANGVGICQGVEVCEPDLGWSRCSAPTPVEEVCDGIDNECDNLIDEAMDDQPCASTPNPLGSCPGTESCEGPAGWVCDAPNATIEVCDGLDNDCNETIDDGLCFDGNPCTHDICDPVSDACSYPPFSGPCDDGNLCTTDERCIEGACNGSPVSCDDGNQCTADSCNATLGCINNLAEGTPCETGNFCTSDLCSAGLCSPGPSVDCGTPHVCLAPSCDPAVGCTTTRLSGNACDDDDGCTVSDVCSNGSCIGGRPYCQGRDCSNCTGDWSVGLGGTCLDLGFAGPQCICICL